jgi:hypothetical protein
MPPPITATRSSAVNGPSSPAIALLVRLRYRRIHDLTVLSGAGGQFDDIAVGIAEIDRPDKAVVDWPGHLSTALALSSIASKVSGSTPGAMCRSSESWRLKTEAYDVNAS